MVSDYLEKRRQGKIIPRKKTLSQEVKKSIYMLIFTLLAIIIILSIVLLLSTSNAFQRGYTLQEQQNMKEQLEAENRQLIDKIIKATIYSKVENSPLLKGMIKSENPVYLEEAQKK